MPELSHIFHTGHAGFGLVEGCLGIIEKVCEQISENCHNKSRLTELRKRLEAICDVHSFLKSSYGNIDADAYSECCRHLESNLKDFKQKLDKHEREGSIKKFFLAKHNAVIFDELNVSLSDAIQTLQAGLGLHNQAKMVGQMCAQSKMMKQGLNTQTKMAALQGDAVSQTRALGEKMDQGFQRQATAELQTEMLSEVRAFGAQIDQSSSKQAEVVAVLRTMEKQQSLQASKADRAHSLDAIKKNEKALLCEYKTDLQAQLTGRPLPQLITDMRTWVMEDPVQKHAWQRWSHMEDFHVPPEVTDDLGASSGVRADLHTAVNEFLAVEDKNVCLLLGDTGTGKSLFTELLFKRLWDAHGSVAFASSVPMAARVSMTAYPPIPIRLEMKAFSAEGAKQCIKLALYTEYKLKPCDIELLKASELDFVFILDGLDELAGGGLSKLCQANECHTWGRSRKVIVGCRQEYLAGYPSYKKLLSMTGEPSENTVLYLAPFSSDQKQRYFKSCVDHGRGDQTLTSEEADEQIAFLAKHPALDAMVNSPFLLQLYVKSYPEMVKQLGGKADAADIKRVDLYTAFMQAWFIRQEEKLIDSVLETAPGPLRRSFAVFSQDLAFEMFKYETNEINYDPNDMDYNPWHDFFASEDPKVVDARKSCPLHVVDMEGSMRRYGFIHQSILEFLVAQKLWQALLNPKQKLKDRQAIWGARCLMKEPRMPVVVELLSDWILSHDRKEEAKQALLELVTASKLPDCEPFSEALSVDRLHPHYSASNAMTALNLGLVSFAQIACEVPETFKGIQIPYANLDLIEASGVDFSGGDLSHASIADAKFSNAIFDGCILAGLDTREYPMLKLDGECNAMEYSPKGDQLAVASGKVITLFRSEDGNRWRRSHVLEGHDDAVTCISYSPDGQQLASSSDDKMVRLWDTRDGRSFRVSPMLKGHGRAVNCVSYSPDGQRLASGSSDRTIRLWNALEGGAYGEGPVLRGHQDKVVCVAFSPDSKQLASGGGNWDKTVRLWSVQTGRPYGDGENAVLREHEFPIVCVSYSPDGKVLASADGASYGGGHTIRLWSLGDGIPYGKSQVLKVRGGEKTCVSFSHNGKLLASSGHRTTVRLWYTVDGISYSLSSVIKKHEGEIYGVKFSPNGKRLASWGSDQTIRFWCPLGAVPYGPSQLMKGHRNGVKHISYSPNGQLLASGGKYEDQTVYLWNTKDGSCYGKGLVLKENQGQSYSVSFLSDGKLLALSTTDSRIYVRIYLWCPQDSYLNGVSHVLKGKEGGCYHFSPDGKLLVSVSKSGRGGTVQLWHTQDGAPYGASLSWDDGYTLRPYEPGPNNYNSPGVSCIVFSPDGNQLALGDCDGSIRVWGSLNARPNGPILIGSHRSEVVCISFSPDGKLLASGGTSYGDGYGEDFTVRLWNVLKGEPFGSNPVLMGHKSGISSVSFSSDSKLLASGGSWDEAVRLWDIVSGAPYRESPVLKGHEGGVNCVNFSPVGEELASGGEDKTICVWGKQASGAYVQLYQIGERPGLLRMLKTSMRDVKGLDEGNQELFKQLGAHSVTLFKPAEAHQREAPRGGGGAAAIRPG